MAVTNRSKRQREEADAVRAAGMPKYHKLSSVAGKSCGRSGCKRAYTRDWFVNDAGTAKYCSVKCCMHEKDECEQFRARKRYRKSTPAVRAGNKTYSFNVLGAGGASSSDPKVRAQRSNHKAWSSLHRGSLSRDIAAVIDGALPIDAELDAIDAKVAKAMQFVRKLADALAVANVGKVGVAVQIAHDYGTGPHGEAQALIGRRGTTRTYASEGGMTDFEYVTGWSMLRSTLPKNAKDFEWLVQRDVQELEDVVSDIVCLWNKPAHDCKRTYGGSSTIAGEVTHATISIWLGDGNAVAKARAAIAAAIDVAPPPSSLEVMAAYLSPMARWNLFKNLPDEKLNEIANLLDKHVEKNTYTTQHWSLRAKELRDITHSRKGKAIAAAAGAGAGEGC